jgi:hypothetical protein
VKAVADGMAPVTAVPAGGLSSAEAADRLARYGPNELPRARATPWWRLVADQVRDPLILVLVAIAAYLLPGGGARARQQAPLADLSRPCCRTWRDQRRTAGPVSRQ